MEKYDVIIIGGATTGSYFGRRLAEAGMKVLLLEKQSKEQVGSKYDIFHILKPDFARFGLPYPEKGDDFVFEFTGSAAYSAYGKHPKKGYATTVGMHLHNYTLRLNRWAEEAGVIIKYDAAFLDLLYEGGKISGVIYQENGEEKTAQAGLVADCSGIPAVVRTRLPENYGVENFKIKPEEMFYVILRYVRYLDEKDYLKGSRSWTYYKTWEAPQADPKGAILGIGANLSYEYAEKIFAEFESRIELPRYELQHREKGVTPYRRPPYSFVADHFIVLGDAASLTKPHAGEGVTSSMVHADIAVEVLTKLFSENKELTLENLWPINKKYVEVQGRIYANMLATLIGAVNTSAKENEFFFKKDIIFSEKSFASMGEDQELKFSTKEILGMAVKMLGGVLTGNLRLKTIRSLLRAMKNGGKISEHYANYPATPQDFHLWVRKADEIWQECGSMADALKQEKGV
jgi:digeranylgeranylglycerophospholipid reductase